MSTPQLLSAFAGHWTGEGTGVTVILPPPGTVASGEVRGGAPATREFELLDPVRLVSAVDAVVLSGGSAFGLAAADGVARLLRDRSQGFATSFGPVPIVVGMSLFDASVATTPPDAAAGRAAALAALSGAPLSTGSVGAGTGATTGKWRGRTAPGGLGVASGRSGDASIAVVVAVNAWGDVLPATDPPRPDEPNADELDADNLHADNLHAENLHADNLHADNLHADNLHADGLQADGLQADGLHADGLRAPQGWTGSVDPRGNTTIAVVVTDARLTRPDCFLLAQSVHTGFARAIHPAHSRYDGDAAVALATGAVPDADLDQLRATTTMVTIEAIRAAAARKAIR